MKLAHYTEPSDHEQGFNSFAYLTYALHSSSKLSMTIADSLLWIIFFLMSSFFRQLLGLIVFFRFLDFILKLSKNSLLVTINQGKTFF